jgi:pilus assembly protein CpaB
MNRQTRTAVVLIIALGAASAASYGVYQAISTMPVREVEVSTAHAVVAARSLPMGAMITRDSVKLVDWPARTPLTGGFDTIEGVLDRGLIAAVVENEPLTENKLAPREAGAGLPPSIPYGMRAMSVRVDEVIGVAGFVVPGTRVDVMVTISQNDESLTRVVCSNVQVLTAGTRYDQENAQKEGEPIPSTVVTLMVSPEDAERITLAQSEGAIMLSLRNPLDTEPTETRGVRTASLFTGGGSAPPPPPVRASAPRPAPRPAAPTPAPAVAPPPVYTVEAIRAAKRTEETVR